MICSMPRGNKTTGILYDSADFRRSAHSEAAAELSRGGCQPGLMNGRSKEGVISRAAGTPDMGFAGRLSTHGGSQEARLVP